jgi:hypothetical protein
MLFVHPTMVYLLARPLPRATTVLAGAWMLWLLVHWYAVAYSPFPNQIHWAYSFAMLALAIMLFPANSPLSFLVHRASRHLPGLKEYLLLIGLYFLAFYIVSFWELFPGTTVIWGKFEIVEIAVAITYYMFARSCSAQTIVTAHHNLGVALVTLTLAQLALDQEAIRYGYGYQLMLCLPASMLLRKYWFVALGLAVMLASQHKTPLICACLAVAIMFLFARPEKPRLSQAVKYMRVAHAILAVMICATLLVAVFPRIVATLSRFIGTEGVFEFAGVQVEAEGIDVSRVYIVERSLELLREFFPAGMGYMNFFEWTGLEVTDVRTTRLGVEVGGISLHNSFITWVLEGGLLVSAAVLYIFWRVSKRIRALLLEPASRNLGVLCIAWAVACLLLGGFHQLHQMMQFWGTMALIYGFSDRVLWGNATFRSAPQPTA